MPAPTLIIGYGNPSRGDDALGPAVLAAIEQELPDHPEWGGVECLTDFQLQIEWVLDLAGRQRIVFVDASASGAGPYSFGPLHAKADHSITSHAVSPASLLTVYRSFYGHDAPPSYLLAICGHDFELGQPLSDAAQGHLQAALAMLRPWLSVECAVC